MDLILCALLLLSPQQSKPETVALRLGPEPVRTVIMKTEEAEKLYERLELKRRHAVLIGDDHYLHAALTQALGTLNQPVVECHKGIRENWFGEQFVCGN